VLVEQKACDLLDALHAERFYLWRCSNISFDKPQCSGKLAIIINDTWILVEREADLPQVGELLDELLDTRVQHGSEFLSLEVKLLDMLAQPSEFDIARKRINPGFDTQ